MEFDINNLICWNNRSNAEVGKEYYFMDKVDASVMEDLTQCTKDTLDYITLSCKDKPFIDGWGKHYPFIYPVPEKKKHFLSYEELKERWLKNPTEIYTYKDEDLFITGMITSFNDSCTMFQFGGYDVGESKYFKSNLSIENFTDANGNLLVAEG